MLAGGSVVVTGLGVVSPLGHTPEALADAVLEGTDGRAPLSECVKFDAGAFPCPVGAPVRDFKARDWVDNRKHLKLMTPPVRYGLGAVRKAATAAGIERGTLAADRLGMFVGAGTAFGDNEPLIPALEAGTNAEGVFDAVTFGRDGMPLVNPLWLLKGLSNNVLGYGTASLDAQGINQNYCASGIGGLAALGEAAFALAEGRADAIIAGGADSALTPEKLAAFGRLGLLSQTGAGRAFDADRDGFVPGEGAAFAMLERADSAAERGARPLATIVGYGEGCSVGAFVDGEPAAITAACQRALGHAGWAPADVDVVWAHANGTPRFDQVECDAIRAVFGDDGPPVTAHKGQTGHPIAAGGALAFVLALECARRGRVPAIYGLGRVDPRCAGLDLVRDTAREVTSRRVLVHAAGVGGQTAWLAVEMTAAEKVDP